MYFQLTESIKRRLILELRRFWQSHPRYRDDLVENIQGKYSLKERPQHYIIIKNGGGNRLDLAADNYVGIVQSYVYLSRVKDFPGVAIEWVREDAVAIQRNGGVFPSPPGIYYIELTQDDQFMVDQLLDVKREQVMQTDPTSALLQNPPWPGTLHLYEMPAAYKMVEGIDYSLDVDPEGNPTGVIQLSRPVSGGRSLVADYRVYGGTTGPFRLTPAEANHRAIPGVVLAFGRRNEKGDRLAVVIDSIRRPAALEYGGKWELSVDIDIGSRDNESQQEIADNTAVYLWGVLRPYLSSEGVEMSDLSLGGESEEPYDENGDDYYFTSSLSLTVQTDWSIHVPLSLFLRQASPMTTAQARAFAQLSDDEISSFQNNIQMLESLNLESISDPFFSGRISTFEVIR
jgi:hypothetical protein